MFAFIEDPAAGREARVVPGLVGLKAAYLVEVDEAAAVKLLVRHLEVLPPAQVVTGLQVGAWHERAGRGWGSLAGRVVPGQQVCAPGLFRGCVCASLQVPNG